jgi:hypothetical protein
MKMKDTTTIITILAIVVLLVVLGPILTIWALNTLFPALAIPLTIETWFAIVILGAAMKSSVTVKKS